MKKILSAFMSLTIALSVIFPVSATAEELSDDIVILYTNDVHTYIDGELSYDVISAIKKDLQTEYKNVLLVDAGDHIQGTAYGSMDKGENIIKMMNESEYDIATLGNHEFDYEMSGCMDAINLAEFPYISANFYRLKDGLRAENVLDSYKIFDCGDEKVAFIGITTPETFEKSTSAYFQDENGNFIYGISGGKNGEELQKDVQYAIDEAKSDGATQIIALGHLGVDLSSQPWTSKETISNVSGLNAFIDGHSHTTIKGENVADKDGNDVLLTQTGSYFDRIGIMVIDSETKKITTDFIECTTDNDDDTSKHPTLYSTIYQSNELISDSSVKEIKDIWIEEIDKKLGEKIGYAELTLDNYDTVENRLVRSFETNSGDFAADALYYLFDNMDMDVDVAIMNGGGVRNTAISGDITYKTCKDIHTFGNIACLQTVSGQQILDALEWGARKIGIGENGGFLQVSGLTYKVNSEIESTVPENEMGTWIGSPDTYRVYDVKIYDKESGVYEPIDLDAEYNLAGYNYTLRNLGDGYAMFDGAVNVLDYVMEDYMVLANYVKGFDGGVIGALNSPLKAKYPEMLIDYETVNGSGRIKITENDVKDEIWVGGIKITSDNKNDVMNDGGSVKYDPDTKTLTLTDASISNENGNGIYAYGINLTINGNGENVIAGNSSAEKSTDSSNDTVFGHGIFVEGDGYNGGNLAINGNIKSITSNGGNGIYAYEDITLQGVIEDINAAGDLSSGINSDFGNIIIDDPAVIGDISSESFNGITAKKDIIISGKVKNITGNGYVGMCSVGGDVYITGTVNSITGKDSGIEAYTSGETDGGVAISGKVDKITGGVVGIYTDGYLNISGIAEVTSDENPAISTGKDIIIPDEYVIITEPEMYQIKSFTENDDNMRYTICDMYGNPAKIIKFEGFANQYEDVKNWDWYYSDIAYVTAKGLMSGISNTAFAPNDKLTRAMLVTILYRSEGEPVVNKGIPFADVNSNNYYSNAVIWAAQNGIVAGISENEFAPNENITREQIAAVIYRYANLKSYDTTQGGMQLREFYDYETVSSYALNAMTWAINTGLIHGKTEYSLNPQDNATRAEIAAILTRFMNNVK